jgi:hypothetical protein
LPSCLFLLGLAALFGFHHRRLQRGNGAGICSTVMMPGSPDLPMISSSLRPLASSMMRSAVARDLNL